MNRSLHFAHITDIHISERDESWGVLSLSAEILLATCVKELNSYSNLDFVLFTGDALDMGTQTELTTFMKHFSHLQKPWHFVPGNHDGFIGPASPQTLASHEAICKIDARLATPYIQQSYWSRSVTDWMQLIGLDSRTATDGAGEISILQLNWLNQELQHHTDKLVIIAVHHPLHKLGVHCDSEFFKNIVCRNAQQVEALLNTYPNVKIVLAGHQHANQIRQRNNRFHINTGGLTTYPCSYRLIYIEESQGDWYIRITTHTVADEILYKRAYEVAVSSVPARNYELRDPGLWATFCEGEASDRSYDGIL